MWPQRVYCAVGSGFYTHAREQKRRESAWSGTLRQNLDVSQELPGEMLVLLLRLARADMARLPLPEPEKASGTLDIRPARLVAEPINTTEFAR